MSALKKYLKELETLTPVKELPPEKKLEFLDKQLEGFQTQAYRFEVEIEVAKKYLEVGATMSGDEAYTATGEKNIIEAVQNLRSIIINIEKICQLRQDLIQKYELQ